ncbi:MAG: peptide chain release factor N(5)-glutamine methyltransferase [Pseudoalteromonas tetraodonis]|uniref:peptide chain release factor N(5)-glutamine methyltransferase n=1 Tax=Pseudoalteromonas TaxID=53246 RepID=UPI00044F7836|nr:MULTISPECIES: peptide chain release factor N(5)-glutamine methyltransferase [unclassified Pseudoalteromonas]MDX1359868.1 peptide chain release factor N(5)-glutamine methyltransferase [Pseudoalteromonas tetraodonis]EWS97905.1 SAM-dependent methyltransferase [Pseudoalteromonas sp. SCSIO_11900]MCK8105092.1 peptide chain release factor N(5)-glutamine methyltransferase [Pseudoalteromonas sp. 2CM36K]MCK8137576.1 peptide chain release factor N(5)-glutamine methyltransferase [Pseudoalteromonas sp. 2
MNLTVENAITTGANLLASSSDSAKLDAQVLLLNILQKPRSYLFTWPEKQLTDEQSQAFERACERRLNGEPVSHITGYREFWSLQLEVNPTTLIPRPDTETLVELALSCNVPNDAKVLDLGTGTGAIALALGSEMPTWDIIAVDRIDDAVALAKRNQKRLAINNVCVKQSNWFSALNNKKFDLIVTNPPYIEYNDKHLHQGDVRFEPLSALVADDAGLADIKQIITQSRDYLHSNGYLLIEHGFEQSAAVRHIFNQMAFINVSTVKDLGNNDRVTFGQWP